MSHVVSRSERSLIVKEELPDNTQVIWKLCSPSNSSVSELENEYDITTLLQLDGIRKPLRKGFYEDKVAFAYQYVDGVSLKDFIGNQHLPLQTFLDISVQIVSVIKKLHNAGFLHLRLNSNNVLINADAGNICLIDFSLSTPIGAAKPVLFSDWGSELAYISPEQTGYLPQTIDERSDLYSLGIVMYEMLTGTVPFSSQESAIVVHDHLIKIPGSIKDIRRNIPEVISAIVDKLLSKKPQNRYQAVEGLEFDLQRCQKLCQDQQPIDYFKPGLQDEQPLQLTDRMIGRDDILTSLSHELQGAMLGQNRLCIISGEQGSGKTSVVEMFRKNIRNNNSMVMSGKSAETAVSLPYSTIVDAMKDLASFILSQGEHSSAKWKPVLTKAVGADTAFLVDFIPEYKWIIGKSDMPETTGNSPMAATTDFCSLVLRVIKSVAAQLEVLVIFTDDLQWTDPDSWKCINALVSDTELKNVLFIGAYRTTGKEHDVATSQYVDHLLRFNKDALVLDLPNLGIAGISAFLSASHIRDEDGQLSRLLLSRTLGNPFFLRQFLQTLYKHKILRYNRSSQEWEDSSHSAEMVEITDNVIDSISRSVKDLPAPAQEILLLASCIGSVFEVATLKHLSSTDAQTVAELLLFLKREGFLEQKDEQVFYFIHDRVRKAAYDMLPPDQQAVIHYKTAVYLHAQADAFSPAHIFTLASHYKMGQVCIPAEDYYSIAEVHMHAGMQAKRTAAFQLSYEYFKAAIRLLKTSDWNTHYSTVLTIYNEATEVAMIAGAYTDAEAWLKLSLQHAAA